MAPIEVTRFDTSAVSRALDGIEDKKGLKAASKRPYFTFRRSSLYHRTMPPKLSVHKNVKKNLTSPLLGGSSAEPSDVVVVPYQSHKHLVYKSATKKRELAILKDRNLKEVYLGFFDISLANPMEAGWRREDEEDDL